jgi:hypothetical protein
MQSRRASPRIPYDEAICLSRTDGNGRLYGRAIDLGTGGVALVCSEDCPIGTQVRCDVLLPGGPRQIMGRVVRVTAAPAGFELAVSFEDLKPGVAGVIDELIAARTKQIPAKVQIEGVEQPLRCEASVDDQTVRLTASLPFLKLDRGVNVVLGAEESVQATGTIRKIAVDPSTPDGVPRLALDVDLADSPRARTRRYGTPRAAMATTDAATPAPVAIAAPGLGGPAVTIPQVTIPPTNLPPPFGQPLPSIVVEPALVVVEEPTPATPAPQPIAESGSAPPRRRPAAKRGGAAPAMRGTAVVARRPSPPPAPWQPPAGVMVTQSAAIIAPKRSSLLDAPLSARALVVWAPIVALVTALLVQLSR